MRSGKVCKRRNSSPTARTAMTRNTPTTTIRTSVSPGAAMKDGRWWGAAGLSDEAIATLPGTLRHRPEHDDAFGLLQGPETGSHRHLLLFFFSHQSAPIRP